MEPSRKPLSFLRKYFNNEICVRLRNGVEYIGRLVDCDGYMNLVLEDASMHGSDMPSIKYGSLIIRGSYVLHIRVRRPE